MNPKKLKFLLIAIAFLLTSCTKDNDVNHNALIENYFYKYMVNPNIHATDILPSDNLIYLEYDDNNRIVKKEGGLSEVDSSTGYSWIVDSYVYFDFTYLDDELIIEKKNLLYDEAEYPMNIFLFSNNRIVQKITHDNYSILTFYEYASGKLVKSTKQNLYYHEVSNYHYNIENNLDSIVTKKYNEYDLWRKSVEIFSDYDSSSNPFKHLMMFDETFYRALSKNNFMKYQKKVYNAENILMENATFSWAIPYDNSGNILFGE